MRIELVTVGDCEVDEDLAAALVAAGREVMTNAAKFSRADPISVYAEVTDRAVTIFVRDRGTGFDPDRVSDDRRGIRDSIEGRTGRHGGRASVRSAPGAGTEVELIMPRRRP